MRLRPAVRKGVPPPAVEQSVARDLLDLEETTERLRPFARRYLGIRPIPVDAIVGTDGRGRDFDRRFRARRPDVRERRRRVEQAFSDGGFPPIAVQKLGDAYFVVDGHHRVAVARRLGVETIDAEVVELTARWRLRADAGPLDLRHAEQERVFMAESGLGRILPGLRFAFSRPVGYVQLLEVIHVHGYRLLQAGGTVPERGEVARDWYSRVYLPTVEAIREARLDEVCPEVTDPDPVPLGARAAARARGRARPAAALRRRAQHHPGARTPAARRGQAAVAKA